MPSNIHNVGKSAGLVGVPVWGRRERRKKSQKIEERVGTKETLQATVEKTKTRQVGVWSLTFGHVHCRQLIRKNTHKERIGKLVNTKE